MIMRKENRRSVALSTTNTTWAGPGLNRGLRFDRPAANKLSPEIKKKFENTFHV